MVQEFVSATESNEPARPVFIAPTTPIQLTSLPTLREDIQFRVLDDLSSVAVDPASGQAHALTPVGTAIIERCDGESTVSAIVAEIVDIFDCAPAQAEQDVMTFLVDLSERELVSW